MEALFFSIIGLFSTLAGGLTALRNQRWLNRYLAYAAGVLLGVVAFDLLPEIFEQIKTSNIDPKGPMIALVVGFLLFHIIEKSILIHHSNESEYEQHRHPHVGVASALALIGHSFLDGVGIGLGFQAGTTVGLAVALAVIAHDFTDGLNTVNLMLLNKNRSKKAMFFLFLDAIAPIVGVLLTMVIDISERGLVLYLGFFAGFLLYIGASEILPEAHSKNSSYLTIVLTVVGAAFIFAVTQIV